MFANAPYCQKNYLVHKTAAQNIHLRRIELLPILKCITRMFARRCELKIVVMSESMSQLHFKLVWTRQSDRSLIQKRSFFYLRFMNNLSLKNNSSLLKNWSPLKIVLRSEIISETITTHQFLHWKYENFFLRGGGWIYRWVGISNKIQIGILSDIWKKPTISLSRLLQQSPTRKKQIIVEIHQTKGFDCFWKQSYITN